MELDDISNIVAKDIGLTKLEVQQINRSQWRFLLDTIQSGTFDPVSIIYLGKFSKNDRYRKDRRNINRMEELVDKIKGNGDSI